ncbi:hypothetical protein [Rossellomorea sp. SC111]|nr:hypothetical protein [Rossellomorea sp. SC111]
MHNILSEGVSNKKKGMVVKDQLTDFTIVCDLKEFVVFFSE